MIGERGLGEGEGGREGDFTGSLTIDGYVQNVKASLRALHFFCRCGGFIDCEENGHILNGNESSCLPFCLR